MGKLYDIISKVAQYRDETLEKPDYMEPREAEQAILELLDEAIGGDEGGKYYSTRKWKEIDGLTARNELRQEIRKKVGL